MNKLKTLAITFFLLAATSAYADQFVSVTVNTSSIAGTSGSLDFMFNPGPTNGQAATVSVLDFNGGSYAGGQQDFGDVSGGPVGTAPLVINNTDQDNEDFEDFTFGNTITFLLDFSGPAVISPNGTSTSTSLFAFSMFSDPNGTIPVLTNDPNGVAFTSTVNLDGTLTNGLVSPDVQVTPEPSSICLVGSAFAMLGGRFFRRRKA